jgi:hypothetical protein
MLRNKMSVYIVRAFVRLREFALSNETLARKVDQIENRVNEHVAVLTELIREIRQLIETPIPEEGERKIGLIPPIHCNHG